MDFGGSIVRIDNGIAMTASGVQAYGRSTVDRTTNASGLARASGGQAANGTAQANYMTGAVRSIGWSGGLSAMHFGPTTAASPIPSELGGVFSVYTSGGRTAIGGFIVRR